ncbi:hypothetical protein JMJ35_005670 [Cladonia borealis]|uniref:Phosphatidylserine decarboxylase proenzyme 1, mitochondrial n=1 Tax=Cladonia borealis TaxID=184061 RepID=A0AA39R131_9LECA|nr:hypothetical protein JMJ35_005670 [Cladonia borealis]
MSLMRSSLSRRTGLFLRHQSRTDWICLSCQRTRSSARFSKSARARQEQQQDSRPFGTKLRTALRNTKIQWKPIPVGLGIAFLGAVQFYRVRQRETRRQYQEDEDDLDGEGRQHDGEGNKDRPRKRRRIRPSGPWQVQVMSTLPLKAISRLWGRFNELEIPYFLRVPGFKLYSWIFGVNLSEISEPDLHQYKNLASFFYRNLKPGVRPIDSNASALLSPADGRVLQYGIIENGEVEQVKGMTYSLEALLGTEPPGKSTIIDKVPNAQQDSLKIGDEDVIKADEEFARVNGISYSLPNLFSGPHAQAEFPPVDASTQPKHSSESEVRADLALGDGSKQSWFASTPKAETALYYIVFYLAPGDYHRFHSPASWVVEKRRHFAGELYSAVGDGVFFSYTPVGATNVGSIKINFDRELRTNSLTTDTAADRAAEEAAKRGEPYSGFAEATYGEASKILGGHALRKGEEMGGFQLGSSIVLIFEAPKGHRKSFDEGWEGGTRKGGWQWNVAQGQKVKYGQAIGWVED